MNKLRRKELETIIAKLEEAMSALEYVREDERGAMDNMPESLQDTDRYYAMEEAVDGMDSAGDTIQEAIDAIQDVIDA